MARKSPPPANKCVAKLWRNACGLAVSGKPRSRAASPSGAGRAADRAARRARRRRAVRRRRAGAGMPRDSRGSPRDRRQHRRHARLAPLARDRQHVGRDAPRAAEAERLGEPQAAAVEQRQHRRIALALPTAGRGRRRETSVAAASPTVSGFGTGGALRRAHRGHRRVSKRARAGRGSGRTHAPPTRSARAKLRVRPSLARRAR